MMVCCFGVVKTSKTSDLVDI